MADSVESGVRARVAARDRAVHGGAGVVGDLPSSGAVVRFAAAGVSQLEAGRHHRTISRPRQSVLIMVMWNVIADAPRRLLGLGLTVLRSRKELVCALGCLGARSVGDRVLPSLNQEPAGLAPSGDTQEMREAFLSGSLAPSRTPTAGCSGWARPHRPTVWRLNLRNNSGSDL